MLADAGRLLGMLFSYVLMHDTDGLNWSCAGSQTQLKPAYDLEPHRQPFTMI